ncbi:MAG: dihydroorotate dehydrogenase [Acidimicrobiia bacterium]|nr:MAG: dihydroorotate dehydrogenase [Acidimicrobiia bacterium]
MSGTLDVNLGPVSLSTPLVAASGTVGSVVEFAKVIDWANYGAATAKSVAPEPWPGRKPPRLAPTDHGMLNGIGIQNPGIDVWLEEVGPSIETLPTQVWGSVVAHDTEGFAVVASRMAGSGVAAVEVNLSCPNLEGTAFALDPVLSGQVVAAVRAATDLPIGAKLSPDATPILPVADSVMHAGADWVVVANTVLGAAINVETRRPVLSGLTGGYSGSAIRPITMRCVLEIASGLPEVPILACGGVSHANHVLEYMLAGASAVAIGTAHFAQPRVANGIIRDLHRYMRKRKIDDIATLTGAYEPW